MVGFNKFALAALAMGSSLVAGSPIAQSDVAWSGPAGPDGEGSKQQARDVAGVADVTVTVPPVASATPAPNKTNTSFEDDGFDPKEPAFVCWWGRQFGIWDRFLIFAKNRIDVERVGSTAESALMHQIAHQCGAVTKKSWLVEQGATNGTLRFNLPIGEADCVDYILTQDAKTHIPCRRRKVKDGELVLDKPN